MVRPEKILKEVESIYLMGINISKISSQPTNYQ